MPDPDWALHCVEPVAAHVRLSTGRDVWAEIGSPPRTPREAAQMYRAVGVTCLRDLVSRLFGEPVEPKRAQRGDIVMVQGVGGTLGICRGELVECLDRMVPISLAICAWRIG